MGFKVGETVQLFRNLSDPLSYTSVESLTPKWRSLGSKMILGNIPAQTSSIPLLQNAEKSDKETPLYVNYDITLAFVESGATNLEL